MTNPVNGATGEVVQQTPDEVRQEACACGHPLAHHDATAIRYCAATILGSLTRGCACAARSATP